MIYANQPSLFPNSNAMSLNVCYILIIITLFTTIFIACDIEKGTDIDPEKVYQGYLLEYSYANNKTQARATFRKNGRFGNILTDISCTVNGRPFMDYIPWNYFPYGSTYSGLLRNAKSSFIDSEGREHLNFLTTDSISPIHIPDTFNFIQIDRDTIMPWIGTPLGSDETAILILSTSTNYWEFSTSSRGDSTIPILRSAQLSLVPGSTEASLKRIRYLPLDDATTAGGIKQVSMISMNKSIMILSSN